VLDGIAKNGPDGDAQVETQVRGKVRELCARFPIYRD
jgi:glycine hydroxymethyltransferase